MTTGLYEDDLDPENGGERHRRLVAEIQRLRGLVKRLEWGSCDGCGNRYYCTECEANRAGRWDDATGEYIDREQHAPSCPVFNVDGSVR